MGINVDTISERLLKIIEDVSKNMEEMDHGLQGIVKTMTTTVGKLEVLDKHIELQTKSHDFWMKQRDKEVKVKEALLDIESKLSAQKFRQKMDLDRQHEEGVQRNIRLRHNLADMNQSFSSVTRMLRGVSLGGGVGMVGGGAVGLVKKQMDISSLERAIGGKEANLTKLERDFASPIKSEQEKSEIGEEIHFLKQDLRQTKQTLGQEKDSPQGQLLENNKHLKGMAQKMEGVGNWIGKNKTGIIISAASLGLLVGLFKKMLSVSPMLQKMLELMNMTFGLILRPFGDFLGFILRPIAMMFLASVMPFFKEAYPLLAELGTALGGKLAELLKGEIDPIEFLKSVLNLTFTAITPASVLAWVFGSPEEKAENQEGAVGALAGGAAVAALPAAYVGTKATTAVMRKGMGLFGFGGNTKPPTPPPKIPSSGSGAPIKPSGTGSGSSSAINKLNSMKNMIPKSLRNLAPAVSSALKNPAMGQLLKRVPYLGTALMLGSVGFGLLRHIVGEEEYQKMYKELEWMGGAQDLFMSEQKLMAEGQDTFNSIDPMLGGGLSNRFGQTTTSSSGVTTYNIHNETNIGNIAKEVDETEVQQKLETTMSEYGYMSG
jgi:hypothetical protein